jgi:hypothetical protein
VTGKSGSGKSSYYNKFLLAAEYDKFFIYDHEGEFAFRNNLPACYQITEDYIANNRYIIYDPTSEWEGNLQEGFNYFAELSFRLSQSLPGRKLFACDELQKMVGVHEVTPELAMLVETGRRYEVDTIFVSQQPNIIHNRLRNQLTEVVTFAHVDKRATSFLTDIGFDEPDLMGLNDLEFIAIDLRTMNQTRGQIVFDNSSEPAVTSQRVIGAVSGGDSDSQPSHSQSTPEKGHTSNVS